MSPSRPSGEPDPGKEPILTEEQILSLASPARRELFETLIQTGPASAAELATALARAPDSLYYHLRHLQRAGLVRVEGKRKATTRDTMVYAPTTQLLKAHPTTRDRSYLLALLRMFDTMLRALLRRLEASVLDPDTERAGPAREVTMRTLITRLDEDQLVLFNKKIEELCELLIANAPSSDGELYQVVIAATRTVKRSSDGPSENT